MRGIHDALFPVLFMASGGATVSQKDIIISIQEPWLTDREASVAGTCGGTERYSVEWRRVRAPGRPPVRVTFRHNGRRLANAVHQRFERIVGKLGVVSVSLVECLGEDQKQGVYMVAEASGDGGNTRFYVQLKRHGNDRFTLDEDSRRFIGIPK